MTVTDIDLIIDFGCISKSQRVPSGSLCRVMTRV